MMKHAAWLMPLGALALAGCATETALDIRPVGRQASAAGQPVSVRMALAQGHLALGNVALALEEYRRAEREQPGSALALAGMAQCYRLMGRADLARRYFEQALAVAPSEPALYHALAETLDQSGQAAAARSVRSEVAARIADHSPLVTTAAGSLASLPAAIVPLPSEPIAPPASPARTATASVTVMLPPARPLQPAKSAARLERLSSGEVALLTHGTSPWVARHVAVSPRLVRVMYDQRDKMIVLNGARVAGIAARTRDYLAARGFGGARIGNAPTPRARSLIRFPIAARARALRIAAQFRFAPAMEASEGPLTLIVGRDSAPARASRGG